MEISTLNDLMGLSLVSGAASAAQTGAEILQPRVLDPAETRVFAELMRDSPHPAAAIDAGNLRDVAIRVASNLNGDGRSPVELVKTLRQVDMTDPIAFQYQLMETNAQIQAYFQRNIITTGLASAAVNVIQGLLRNKE